MDGRIAAFIGVSAVLVIIPGPDMVLIAKNVVSRGRRSGFLTTAGTLTGILFHAVAAVLGLSAIVATSATAFFIVKLAGAAYLIFLGIQTLRESRQRVESKAAAAARNHRGGGFVQGVLTNILNPKVALFFLTFLPQFVDPEGAIVRQTVMLAAIFWLMGAAWLVIYTVLVDRISRVFARPRFARVLQRVSAAVLVGLGVRLAVERR